MSGRRNAWIVLCLAACVLAWFPAGAQAATSNVGENVESLLKGYASDLYGGVVAIFSLVFLVNRRHTELAVFLFASIVVAWMVFAPGDIAKAGETTANQIFG
jgi:hypothetical protein